MPLLLNCDLAETNDPESAIEKAVMPHIDMANVACGFHAGSVMSIRNTLALANDHGVQVGAHPGYADPDNFGRVSIPHSKDELSALLCTQIARIKKVTEEMGMAISYIKPHGALYNDIMADQEIRLAVMDILQRNYPKLSLLMLATPQADLYRREAAARQMEVIFETFADRCYDDRGFLVPRTQPGAVHDHHQMLEQVRQLCEQGTVTSLSGKTLPIDASTLCVHGDNPNAVAVIGEIRQIVDSVKSQG